MKEFEKPKMEVVEFDVEDVITASGSCLTDCPRYLCPSELEDITDD